MIITLLLASMGSLLFSLALWVWYLKTKNPGVVDVGWAIGILLCGSFFILSGAHQVPLNLKTDIAWILLCIWSIRLSGYLWQSRVSKKHVEKRYIAISENWRVSKSLGFLANYLLQGLLMVINALPFLFIARITGIATLTAIDYLAIMVIILGIAGETLSDWQLQQFKHHHPKKVCNQGLWLYSRHPNYFFECMTWTGFAALAWSADYGYLAFISPLFLISLMTFVTGPITEKSSIASRGEAYLAYQRTTSMIIPWPKRKSTP